MQPLQIGSKRQPPEQYTITNLCLERKIIYTRLPQERPHIVVRHGERNLLIIVGVIILGLDRHAGHSS